MGLQLISDMSTSIYSEASIAENPLLYAGLFTEVPVSPGGYRRLIRPLYSSLIKYASLRVALKHRFKVPTVSNSPLTIASVF